MSERAPPRGISRRELPVDEQARSAGASLPVGFVALLNRVELLVDGRGIEVKQRPLPWPGRTIARAELGQLYVRRGWPSRQKPDPADQRIYLCATVNGRRDVILVAGLDTLEQAHYLEREIERALGIDDEPVTGALPAQR